MTEEKPDAGEPRAAEKKRKYVERIAAIEGILLLCRWLQLPLLVGLVLALIVFEIVFVKHLLSIIFPLNTLTRESAILVTLDLIDMVLIANLVVMVVISGYETFISRLHSQDETSVPLWMRRSTTGKLKLRIATTILLISTIHLLHLYLDPAPVDEDEAKFMLIAQLVFIVTAAAFVFFNWLEHGRQTSGDS
ncbi:MAG: YqhA family protein [Kiloniellales bacterium]|nr:YqhA family protein [Kiloniellales bacterium]